MIEFTHNTDEIQEQVENATQAVGFNFTVGLDLEGRSITILYWQAVNHGRDATDPIRELGDPDAHEALDEPFSGAMVRVGETTEMRREAAERIGEALRTALRQGIDIEDLIDTGQLRDDVETCALVFEGI